MKNEKQQAYETATKMFLNNEVGQVGNYFALPNALVFRRLSVDRGMEQDVCALKIMRDNRPVYLANSSRLDATGTYMSFGRWHSGWGTTDIQKCLINNGVPMLPFSAFIEAGLKITDIELLDQTGSETVKREVRKTSKGKSVYEKVHFTGASLFKLGDKYFLFDIDRAEIEHGIFNPFLTEMPVPVRTVAEAYLALVPALVKDALKRGLTVKRQGEHFFIKRHALNMLKPDKEKDFKDELVNVQGRLTAQGNRDHVASMFNAKSELVSGMVEHNGREHKALDLSDGWYQAVPNTAVKSFTLTGDVD